MKNQQASIHAKLLNLSRELRLDFVIVSRLYMQEGVLRRISTSQYSSSFFLKGGLLLYSLTGFTSRPTQDIDFLGLNIPGEEAQLINILQEILSYDPNDGLTFLTDTITLNSITEGAEYQGQRIKVICTLGNIRTVLKMDIGFGDIIYPEPIQMDYPTLLKNNNFIIQTYSLESVVAEKFEAMIVLDARNSRMKDFFDIYDILIKNEINETSLREAIILTMKTRHTITPDEPAIFNDSFSTDVRNLQLWASFLNRIKAEPIDFGEVLNLIRKKLESIYKEILESD